MDSRHFRQDRLDRELLINYVIGDTNNVICTNVKDRGHKNGPERFELTDKGVIKIYNVITNMHITDIVARPKQIYDRLEGAFLALPYNTRRKVIDIAMEHQRLGYNNCT